MVHTDEFILTAVKGFIKQSRGYTPGLMSCYRHLRKQGLSIDYKRLRRIMQDNGLYHRYHRKYVKTTDSEHQSSCVSNLLDRRFDNFGINEAWCGDITHIPTKEGWLYLASVIDLGTRRLVGYSFGTRMTQFLIVEALQKEVKGYPKVLDAFDKEAMECFDVTPWLPWNWVKDHLN